MSTDVPGIGTWLPIQAVSEQLGVPTATIRSWERRYGLFKTARTGGGHRRYSPGDVAALQLMRDEVNKGRRPADAAVVVRDADDTEEPYRSLVAALLRVTQTLDARQLDSLLDHSRDRLGIDSTISNVILPAMRQLGLAWQTGTYDIGQEHVISQATRGWLKKILFLGPVPWRPHSIVLCCGPGELHTIGLEAMEVLLSQRGWRCHMLGADTPPAALTSTLDRTAAIAVILVSHIGKNRETGVAVLRAAERMNIELFYAGNAFLTRTARDGVPGTYLGEDLLEAVNTVAAVTTSAQSR